MIIAYIIGKQTFKNWKLFVICFLIFVIFMCLPWVIRFTAGRKGNYTPANFLTLLTF